MLCIWTMRATAAVAILFLWQPPASAASAQGSDVVAAGYTRLYSGDRDGAFTHFESLRKPDPENLPYWFGQLFAHQARIEIDDSLAPAFERDIALFLDKAEERYRRSEADAEALFYLMQGYLLRSTYRLNFDKGVWGAARDAAKSKGYADRYIKRHPEHGDAYVALGLYNYFVDIAPNFVKVLRVLLFLPSGSRTEGLKQIERAAREGSLFAPLAETALADIYAGFEGRLADGIRLAERLVQRYPANVDFRFELAQMYANPIVEAYDQAAQQYSAVLERSTGSSREQLRARYNAIFGLSGLRRTQWRLEDAIALLTPVIDQAPSTPPWVMPNALLRRANYRALVNEPGAADDARRVLKDPKMASSHKAAERQIAFIDGRRGSPEASIYASLVPGNRLVVEHKWAEAAAVYDRVEAAHPGDWQVRYRRAYLAFARGDFTTAGRLMHEIVTSRARMPNWLKAAAMLNLAWTHDLGGRRAEAIKLYKAIIDDYEDEGPSGAARVGLVTPYKRST